MYKYIVTGTPRSGTTFMADMLTQGGLPCNHELFYGMAGFGTVRTNAIAESSSLAVPFLERDRSRMDYEVIHVVRNPLKVVSSLIHDNFLSYKNLRRNVFSVFANETLPEIQYLEERDRYLYYWIYWNKAVEKHAGASVRLEDVVKDPKGFFKNKLGMDVDKEFDTSPKNAYSNVKYLTLKDFEGCEHLSNFIAKAKEYGYCL